MLDARLWDHMLSRVEGRPGTIKSTARLRGDIVISSDGRNQQEIFRTASKSTNDTEWHAYLPIVTSHHADYTDQ
jgi:hypothetical protein